MFRRRKTLPNTITPDQIEGARLIRNARLYLWETLEGLHRNENPESEIDYAEMVGRRQAIIKLNNHDVEHFSSVPRGGVAIWI